MEMQAWQHYVKSKYNFTHGYRDIARVADIHAPQAVDQECIDFHCAGV